MTLFSDKFIKSLEKELKAQPDSKCFSVLAQVYYEQGDYKKAEQLCLDGLKYHPSHLPALLILAEVYMSLEQKDQAGLYLNRAKRIAPNQPKIYEKLARLYTKQNLLEQTIEAYKTLLVLRPDHQVALDMLSYLEPFAPSKERTVLEENNSKEDSTPVNLREDLDEKKSIDPIEELDSLEKSISLDLKEKLNSKEDSTSIHLEDQPDVELKEKSALFHLEDQMDLEEETISLDLESESDEDEISAKKETSGGVMDSAGMADSAGMVDSAEVADSVEVADSARMTEPAPESHNRSHLSSKENELKKRKLLKLNQMLARVESYIEKSRV